METCIGKLTAFSSFGFLPVSTLALTGPLFSFGFPDLPPSELFELPLFDCAGLLPFVGPLDLSSFLIFLTTGRETGLLYL